jgi:hypothetical protein
MPQRIIFVETTSELIVPNEMMKRNSFFPVAIAVNFSDLVSDFCYSHRTISLYANHKCFGIHYVKRRELLLISLNQWETN